jgi:hypothetical protein
VAAPLPIITIGGNVEQQTQEGAMRIRTSFATSLLLAYVAVPSSLIAQKRTPNFDGAWRWVRTEVASPDSSYQTPGWPGISIISGRHFAQFHENQKEAGVQQASQPTSAEQKAARYDNILARTGTFEVHDSSLVVHVSYAKSPAAAGTTFAVTWRLRGDTLWQWGVSKWQKDSRKSVRTTYVYARVR